MFFSIKSLYLGKNNQNETQVILHIVASVTVCRLHIMYRLVE